MYQNVNTTYLLYGTTEAFSEPLSIIITVNIYEKLTAFIHLEK